MVVSPLRYSSSYSEEMFPHFGSILDAAGFGETLLCRIQALERCRLWIRSRTGRCRSRTSRLDGLWLLSLQLVPLPCLVQQKNCTRVIGVRDFLGRITDLRTHSVCHQLQAIGFPHHFVFPGRNVLV